MNGFRKRGFGLGIVALGLVYLALALGLPMHTIGGPGPGLFPVVVATILLLAGLLAIWSKEEDFDSGSEEEEAQTLWSAGVVFCALVAFCLLFQRIGYVLSGIMVMTATLKTFKVSWLFALGVSVVSVLATYLLFQMLLGLTLPPGTWLS